MTFSYISMNTNTSFFLFQLSVLFCRYYRHLATADSKGVGGGRGVPGLVNDRFYAGKYIHTHTCHLAW